MTSRPRTDAAERLLAALQDRRFVVHQVPPVYANEDERLEEDPVIVLSETVPPIVRATLTRMRAPDADIEEITQDVVVACWKGRSTAATPGEAVRFVQTIARNAYLDLTRRARKTTSDASAPNVPAPSSPDGLTLRDVRRVEQRALAILVETGGAARVRRAAAFLAHRLDPDPPPDDPGPRFPHAERIRTRNRVQQDRSVGRGYLVTLLSSEHADRFEPEEVLLLNRILAEEETDGVSDAPGQERLAEEEDQ
jgi:DNA-directed RNA polymerase specialized sigma24 family protein